MKKVPLVVVALAALSVLSRSTSADAPAPSASASADAGPPPAELGPDFPSVEATLTPKLAEWKDAEPVRPTRASPAAKPCAIHRVREWIKIRCSGVRAAAISLVGGQREGVAFWIAPPEKGDPVPGSGEMIFPVRKGDRRTIQYFTFGEGYEGPFGVVPAFVVSEQWTEGDAAPVIVIW